MKKIDTAKITEPLLKGIDKIGKLSKLYRFLISLAFVLLFAGPIVYFSYLPKMKKIDQLNKEYADLDTKLTQLKNKARQLNTFLKKLEALDNEFKIVMKALPEKKEIPTLLASISQSGMNAGLEFVMFKPEGENDKEFYAEIPVSIEVTGDYHNVAMFFDRVAKLPRIVNIDNIIITGGGKEGGGKLSTSCSAVTYRFLEQDKAKKKGK